jgi:hypothetical protein
MGFISDSISGTSISANTIYVSGNSITPKYKVYTALLTQSGGNNVFNFGSDIPQPFVIGITYTIAQNDDNGDFTNIGAPNNNVGTSFVATGTVPASWGDNPSSGGVNVDYNTGAPVVTVLENTIGNIWFTYVDTGIYAINANNLFTSNKTYFVMQNPTDGDMTSFYLPSQTTIIDDSTLYFNSGAISVNPLPVSINNANNIIKDNPIEIRVFN